MKKTFAVLWFALLAPLALAQDNAVTWLKGTWKSNRELSIATFTTKKEVSPEKRAKLESLFGKMTAEFAGDTVTLDVPAIDDQPAVHETIPYTIVSKANTKISLRWTNPTTKKAEIQVITFEGPDRFWMALPVPGWREYYDRVK